MKTKPVMRRVNRPVIVPGYEQVNVAGLGGFVFENGEGNFREEVADKLCSLGVCLPSDGRLIAVGTPIRQPEPSPAIEPEPPTPAPDSES